MRHSLLALVMAGVLAVATLPGVAADLNSQQQKMKDCNAQAAGKTGEVRKTFMSSCLSATAEPKGPNCNPAKSKPCGKSCISLGKVCHKS